MAANIALHYDPTWHTWRCYYARFEREERWFSDRKTALWWLTWKIQEEKDNCEHDNVDEYFGCCDDCGKKFENHVSGCICADCSGAELTARND